MKQSSKYHLLWRALVVALMVSNSFAFGRQATATATRPAPALTAQERDAVSRVKVETIREVTAQLTAKEMQGRGTATQGGERAAKYLADKIAKFGFKPLGDAGTYLQAVKFKSTEILPESSVKAGDALLKHGEDFVLLPPHTAGQTDIAAEILFVGYGVRSQPLNRDDLAGLDVKGKIVVLLIGRPKNADKAVWDSAVNPQAVIGGLLTGGPAALIITNAGTEEEPYSLIASYLSRRRVELADKQTSPFKLPPMILVSDDGAEKLFAGSGTGFAQSKQKAESGEFASRSLSKTAAVALRIKSEETIGSNVVGVLEGSDPKLKQEAIIYSAHYDAYGMDADGKIYPGAADNALGVGMISAIAEAFAKTPVRPRRSIIYLAVTGEEHGLLGADHWVKHPTWPLEKVAANLNYDGVGTEVYGPVKRIVGFGAEHSNLGSTLEAVAAASSVAAVPDPVPEENAFVRSDHYVFVKKGVPALMLMGLPEGDMPSIIARIKKWMKTDYHQTTDTVRADWNWDGPRVVAALGLVIGMRVAEEEAMPAWFDTSRFNRPRGTPR